MALPIIPIVTALTSLAPTIGKWIAGDKGEEAAQDIANIARQVTGQNDTQKAVDMVLTDEKSKLAFMSLLEQNRTKLDELYLQDRENAREMYGKHNAQADKVAERVMKYNIWFVLIMVAMNIGVVHVFKNQTELVAIASNIIGIAMRDLLAERHSVTAFYFGSSLGSKNKK